MEEKLRFVFEYERDEHSMVELCSRYGICLIVRFSIGL